jgi:hypothetical protein
MRSVGRSHSRPWRNRSEAGLTRQTRHPRPPPGRHARRHEGRRADRRAPMRVLPAARVNRLRSAGQVRADRIRAGRVADGAAIKGRICACGCQTGPRSLKVAVFGQNSTRARENLERSIEMTQWRALTCINAIAEDSCQKAPRVPLWRRSARSHRPGNRHEAGMHIGIGQTRMNKRPQTPKIPSKRRQTGPASRHDPPRVAARNRADGRASTRAPGSGVAGSGRLHVCRRVAACVHRSLDRLGPAPGPRAGPPA